MLLSQNERFLAEYKRYSDSIASMPDGEVKIELQTVLNKLVACVAAIDQSCVVSIPNKNNNDTVKNLRQEIQAARKKLSTVLGIE
jgi:vacuolar-type H+-ATPase subunit E/Vma4